MPAASAVGSGFSDRFLCSPDSPHPFAPAGTAPVKSFRLLIGGIAASVLLFVIFSDVSARADGPADNNVKSVRPVPPPGEMPQADKLTELQAELAKVEDALAAAKLAAGRQADAWYPDVTIFTRAVRLAIEQQTFYRPQDFATAQSHLRLAKQRLAACERGLSGLPLLMEGVSVTQGADEPAGHRLLVGGFRSKIDGSVQPYGLIMPAHWTAADDTPRRLDVWLHGRGERELELQFLGKRQRDKGYYSPTDAFVLHPFGRYCNAFKFAGETDVFEAIEHLEQLTAIDPRRISIRGFSMGGAGCWQLAVHYPGYWMAATPGAGFSETLEFLRLFQKEDFQLDEAGRTLLNWYDCPPWVNNLRNLPTIAYSGELDRQRQAAEIMVAAAAAEGFPLPHVIGPQTEHKIHPESQSQIAEQMDQWAIAGRPLVRRNIDFTTFTLRYARCDWVHVEGLRKHWSAARVQANITDAGDIQAVTNNVTHLKLAFTPEQTSAIKLSGQVTLDGQTLYPATATAGDGWKADFVRQDDTWFELESADASLRKRPGLQGPIDDAFSDSFVVVTPSRPAAHGVVERWVSSELNHLRREWPRQFRGQLREVADTAVDAAIIRDHNLVLFGDPTGNRLLAQIIAELPIEWSRTVLRVGDNSYPVETSAVAMIFPNPLNPNRYVVLNSGFTYRQYAYLNNARQIAQLPDWAVLDVSAEISPLRAGETLASGFFSEQWRLAK